MLRLAFLTSSIKKTIKSASDTTFYLLAVIKNEICRCLKVVGCNREGGIPARNAAGDRLLLYIGIIDILQSYRLKKQLEHAMKSMLHDGVGYLICCAE